MHNDLIQEVIISEQPSYGYKRSLFQRGFLVSHWNHSWKDYVLQRGHGHKQSAKTHAFPARRGKRQSDETLEILSRFRDRN